VLLAAGGRGGNAQSTTAASPQILFAEAPALLILIDGDPVYRPVAGTDLERIINTRALIVRERAGIHYLKVLDGWMEAYTLTGEWSPSGVAPTGGAEALERVSVSKTVDLLDGSGSAAGGTSLATQAPTILISSEPAELIVTDGPARYQTVEGTSLEQLVNTTATIFREPTDQELYALVASRWFRAWTTDGPWQFIPGEELPTDIAAWLAKTRKHDDECLGP
jgi:hypothetical protein